MPLASFGGDSCFMTTPVDHRFMIRNRPAVAYLCSREKTYTRKPVPLPPPSIGN